MSGDEDVQQRRDKIVETLRKEGYEAARDGYGFRAPNKFSVNVYMTTYQEEEKWAQGIVDRFHLKKYMLWDPWQDYRVGDGKQIEDGGYAPYQ
jgi:hypothetical protein